MVSKEDIKSFMQMTGLYKQFDDNDMSDELKKIDTETIDETIDEILNVLGVSDNHEMRVMVSMVANGFINNIKSKDITDIGENIADIVLNIDKTIDIDNDTIQHLQDVFVDMREKNTQQCTEKKKLHDTVHKIISDDHFRALSQK